jgi:hypothetical protein
VSVSNDGVALGAGWDGRPSYRWRSLRPPDPLFFPVFGLLQPRCRRGNAMATNKSVEEDLALLDTGPFCLFILAQ